MRGEYNHCRYCGIEITQGRSDKICCDKKCYNRYKNAELRENLKPLKKDLKAYKRTYLALKSLAEKYGWGKEVPLSEAVQTGLDRNAPCISTRLRDVDGECSRIGELAYGVSDDLKYIIIYKLRNGRS